MNIKSAVIVGGIIIVILGALLYFVPAPQEKEGLYVSYEVREDTYEILVEYPVLPYEQAQTSLEEIVSTYVKGFEETVQEFGKSPTGRPYLLIVEDAALVESQHTVGINLLVYQDFGGAHGLPQFIGLNFTKDGGEEVVLEEALSLLDTSLEDLAAEATLHFEETLGESFFREGAEPREENYSSFVIGDDEVTFYFQPYQVAAYALGIQEYSFSY